MGSTKHDQTRAIGMTAARTDAPTQARGVRALWRVRQAQHGDLLATRRYDAAELASFVRPHTPLTRTLDLARSLEPRPRAQARAHPAGASSTDELADLLEPIVMPIAIGLRARSVACLHRRRPALFACGLLVLLLSGAGMAAPRMRRPDRRAPAAVQPTPAPLARERAAAPPAEPAQAAAATVSTKPEPAPEATPADAIGSLAGARYGEALARYQQLARAQPTRPAYAAVVAILEAQAGDLLRATRGARRRGMRSGALSRACAGWLALAACSEPPPPAEHFVLALHAQTSHAEPVAGVRFWADGRELGASSAQGSLQATLTGQAERAVTLSVACPAAYRTLEPRRRVLLHRAAAHEPIELSIGCEALDHLAVIIVRARAVAPLGGLPVLSDGQVVGQTEADGTAHVLLRARAGNALHIALDTSTQPQWTPRDPVQTFELGNEDALLLFDQHFTRVSPRSQPARAHATRNARHGPYRIDSAIGL